MNLSIFNKVSAFAPFMWFDIGNTYYKEGPLQSQTVSTYGLGIRAKALNIDFEAGLGIPISNTLDDDILGIGDSSLYFNAGWRF